MNSGLERVKGKIRLRKSIYFGVLYQSKAGENFKKSFIVLLMAELICTEKFSLIDQIRCAIWLVDIQIFKTTKVYNSILAEINRNLA